ncbi:MAG: 5-oxoprolinase [Acidiferrobacteraceae bacterium]|nr:5-oxoprolinase [Acidiferrobacteraceae bacterium]|tara:strand:- start:9039 stop:11063 length:2025 start_codon:yes stop_codon:yes gene_type:complete
MSTRIGVDIGGTFTDLIFYDDQTGSTIIGKVPTTPDSPDRGVLDAVESALSSEQIDYSQYFLHGTTVGLNSLLERRGAKVGMLCTRGFRDVLEIRRGDRDEAYNMFWQPPPLLVPRYLRIPITGRLRADGKVHESLNENDVIDAAKVFLDEDVATVAITFMNAYANPEHEIKAEEILRDEGFKGEISISHQVSREYREYERSTTTVIDAYVRPRMNRYLNRLREGLETKGFSGNLLVTRSGSGSMTFNEAMQRPFETIMSGPVAGAEGSGELARTLQLGDMVTADVGGTSFDTCMIINGRPQLMYEGQVVGLPVQTPWVDVRSIGAGGGSVAYVDEGGLLRVGPRSAGADPGPASYGRGGNEPALTDAAFILGMLGEGKLASGIGLDQVAAESAFQPVAAALNYSIEETARGVMTIASATMANTIREITIDQGIDPRELSLLAFGGAGPLMSTLLARELGVARIIIPPYAGNFSAWGLLGADLTQATARTQVLPLSNEGLKQGNRYLQEMFGELESRQEQIIDAERIREVSIDMRYVRQEHWLTVPMRHKNGKILAEAEEIYEAFQNAYEKSFAHKLGEDVEIVSLRATVRVPLPRREHQITTGSNPTGSTTGTFEAFSFAEGRRVPFKIYERSNFKSGEEISGPAIITEATATTYVDTDYKIVVDESNCLILT